MRLHLPPDGWWDRLPSPRSAFVSNSHIADNVGRGFGLFKDQFGEFADVDNITVYAPREALKSLIPKRTPTVTAGAIDDKRIPAGFALLLSSPRVLVKETDKEAILQAASASGVNHHCFKGNESKKVVFCGETFTPEFIFKVLDNANIKRIYYLSYAMKGSLKWAYEILTDLYGCLRQFDSSQYNVTIDFAVTFPTEFLHFSRENTHQCADFDKNDRATQHVPLVIVNQEEAREVFGTETAVANFPLYSDSQLLCYPDSVPFYGGASVYPKTTDANFVEDESSNGGTPKRSPECPENGSIVTKEVRFYNNFSHLNKEYCRKKGDLVESTNTVRDATRIVNNISNYVAHAIDGGVDCGMRIEAKIVVPDDHSFGFENRDECDEDEDSWELQDLLSSKQFDFAFFVVWKAFFLQRVIYLPFKVVCQSMLRSYLFVATSQLPPKAQIMSGSKDRNQVGNGLDWAMAKYLVKQMCLQSPMVFGSGEGEDQSLRNKKYFGRCTARPTNLRGSTARSRVRSGDDGNDDDEFDDAARVSNDAGGEDDVVSDSDEEWVPSYSGSRRRAGEKFAEAVEQKQGGRLSRQLTHDQKCFLALFCSNCGYSNRLGTKLICEQFRVGGPQDNSFMWVFMEVWIHFVHVVQGESNNWMEFDWRGLKHHVFDRFFPATPLMDAESAEDGELGMHFCNPPRLPLEPDGGNDGEDNGEYLVHYGGRRIRGQFPKVRVRVSGTHLTSLHQLQMLIWLKYHNGSTLTLAHSRFSIHSPQEIAASQPVQRHRSSAGESQKRLIQLRHALDVSGPGRTGKYRLNNKKGGKFAEADSLDALYDRVVVKLNDPTNRAGATLENWPEMLALKRLDNGERIALLNDYQLSLALQGEREQLSHEEQVLDWKREKLIVLLKVSLKIHKVSDGLGPELYWSCYRVGSTPLVVSKSYNDVIHCVADHILGNEMLERSWPTLLDTTHDDVPEDLDDGESKLFEDILSGAKFTHVEDDMGNKLGFVCIRYDPHYRNGSWTDAFAIGRSIESCAYRAMKRMVEEHFHERFHVVLQTWAQDGEPIYQVDSVFLLRNKFQLPSGGYRTTSNVLDQSPSGGSDSAFDGYINIVDHNNDTQPHVPQYSMDGSDEEGGGGFDEEGDQGGEESLPDENCDNEGMGDRQGAGDHDGEEREGEENSEGVVGETVVGEGVGVDERDGVEVEDKECNSQGTDTQETCAQGTRAQGTNQQGDEFGQDADSGYTGDSGFCENENNDSCSHRHSNNSFIALGDNTDDRDGNGLPKITSQRSYMAKLHRKSNNKWVSQFAALLKEMPFSIKVKIVHGHHQGRLIGDMGTDSTNGCTVISMLYIVRMLEEGSLRNDNILIDIMDSEAPKLLFQLRRTLDRGRRGPGRYESIDLLEAADFFIRMGILNGPECSDGICFIDSAIGNLISDDSISRLIHQMNVMRNVGVALCFNGHTISIIKIGDTDGGFKWNLTDSLPRLEHSCFRVEGTCAESLRRALNLYGTCALIGVDGIDLSGDSRDREDHFFLENDRRVFEAYIFGERDAVTGAVVGLHSSTNENAVLQESSNDVSGNLEGQTGHAEMFSSRSSSRVKGQVAANDEAEHGNTPLFSDTESQIPLLSTGDRRKSRQTPKQREVEDSDTESQIPMRTISVGGKKRKPESQKSDDASETKKQRSVPENLVEEFDGEVSCYGQGSYTGSILTPELYRVPYGPIQVHVWVDRDKQFLFLPNETDSDLAMLDKWQDSCKLWMKKRQGPRFNTLFDSMLSYRRDKFMHYDAEDAKTTTIHDVSEGIIAKIRAIGEEMISSGFPQRQVPREFSTLCHGLVIKGIDGQLHMVHIKHTSTIANIISTFGQIYDPTKDELDEDGNPECGIILVLLMYYRKDPFSARDKLFYDKLSQACEDSVTFGSPQYDKAFGRNRHNDISESVDGKGDCSISSNQKEQASPVKSHISHDSDDKHVGAGHTHSGEEKKVSLHDNSTKAVLSYAELFEGAQGSHGHTPSAGKDDEEELAKLVYKEFRVTRVQEANKAKTMKQERSHKHDSLNDNSTKALPSYAELFEGTQGSHGHMPSAEQQAELQNEVIADASTGAEDEIEISCTRVMSRDDANSEDETETSFSDKDQDKEVSKETPSLRPRSSRYLASQETPTVVMSEAAFLESVNFARYDIEDIDNDVDDDNDDDDDDDDYHPEYD